MCYNGWWMWNVSVAACYCAECWNYWKADKEQLHQQDIKAEAISLAKEKGWLISTLAFCSRCLRVWGNPYSTVLRYGDMPGWVSASLNASPLSSGVWQGSADKNRMQWQPKGARLKLAEAGRNPAFEVSGWVPVGFAPQVRNPCHTAKNYDLATTSCGQGLPNLCPTVDK